MKQYVTTCEYGEDVELCEGVSVRFADAGHLLGSACITVTATENGVTKKLIFSGDLGLSLIHISKTPRPPWRAATSSPVSPFWNTTTS